MIFVDAGAWYALAMPSDPDLQQVKNFAASIAETLVTSDYIVDELLTLFNVRGQKGKAVEWVRDVLNSGGTELVRVGEPDFNNAIRVYEEFRDKQWSFTDCTSYAIIQRLQIERAFTFDHHFSQFGIVTVVPAAL